MSASISLEDSPTGADPHLASQYALRVALQTMKERCISLQQRLAAIEDENISLRRQCTFEIITKDSDYSKIDFNELETLKSKVIELTRQKCQLTEHIAMVATENRQLWSRLSQLTKEKNKNKKGTIDTASATSNLIRSKTFTQHSPNPLLRHKTIEVNLNCEDFSLDNVSLRNYDDTVDQEEINQRHTVNGNNSLGFTYLNDESSDADLGQEVRRCHDGFKDIKMELLKQQSDLKVALSTLKQKRVLEECAQCKLRRAKPEMADKSLVTDDISKCSIAADISQVFHQNGTECKAKLDEITAKLEHLDVNILEQKRAADEVDKMCPMCGQIYSDNVKFEQFVMHVETHFRDESDIDHSIEKNFEFISNSTGNF